MKHYDQKKSHEGKKKGMSNSNNQRDEHVETDRNDNSSEKVDVDSRFNFKRTVPDEASMHKKNIPEDKKKHADAVTATTEFERAATN